jgi:hypothetical protein
VTVDDWNLDAFRELDDQPALPFDAAAPVEEPAEPAAQSRCTSCGEPADGRLCVACERELRLAAERTVVEQPTAIVPTSLTVTAPPLEELFAALEKVQRDASAAIASSAPLPVVAEAAVEESPFDQPVFDQPVFERPIIEQRIIEQPAIEHRAFESPAVIALDEPAVEALEAPAPPEPPAVVALPPASSDPFLSDFAFRVESPVESPAPPVSKSDERTKFDVSEFAIDLDSAVADKVPAPAAVAPPPAVVPEPAFAAAPVFDKAERAIAESKVDIPQTFKPADVPAFDMAAFDSPAFNSPAFDSPAFNKPVFNQPAIDRPAVDKPVVEKPIEKVVAEKPVEKPVAKPVAKPAVPAKPAAKPAAREAAVISTPAASGNSARYIGVAAAIVLVIGAIGIPMGKMFPRTQATNVVVQPTPAPAPRTSTPSSAPATRVEKAIAREASPVTVETPVMPPAPRVVELPKAHATTPAAAPVSTPVPAPPAATATAERVEPKPAAPTRAATTPPTFALPATTAAVAPGGLTEAPAEAPVVKHETPAAPEPAAAPRAAAPPSGPFYEAMDVDEAPQVAARTEPRITEEVQAHLVKEIVIVRVLVSEAGHPVLVRLLRGSRSGRALDAAIVAAVQQWTFTPASKRGQRVTCWLHTAVTVGK